MLTSSFWQGFCCSFCWRFQLSQGFPNVFRADPNSPPFSLMAPQGSLCIRRKNLWSSRVCTVPYRLFVKHARTRFESTNYPEILPVRLAHHLVQRGDEECDRKLKQRRVRVHDEDVETCVVTRRMSHVLHHEPFETHHAT